MVKQIMKRNKKVNLITRKNEKGLASAIRAGIFASKEDVFIVMDTDLSHDSRVFNEMLKYIPEYDLVIASRFVRRGKMKAPIHRVFGSYIMNLFIRLVLFSKIKDNTGGFFAMKKQSLKRMNLDYIFKGYGDYSIRLLYLAQKKKLKIKEIGYTHKFRVKGTSKTDFFRMAAKYLAEVLKIRMGIK
jgi:dolichol-phosphate mannosyltransferase